jgi:hypothetical protein
MLIYAFDLSGSFSSISQFLKYNLWNNIMILPAPDDWKTIFSAGAIGVSLVSLLFARRSWLQTNRPIVSATVETFSGGNRAITYNLVVSNTGNRPAVNVRLFVNEIELNAAMSFDSKNCDESGKVDYNNILRCFSEKGEIALLRNGADVSNSFAYTSGNGKSFWIYDARIPIIIKYFDLEGRKYNASQKLIVKDSEGFAGGMWSKK